MQKGISTLVGIVVIIVIAVVAFGGVFAYQYFTAQTQPVVQTQQNQNTEPSITVILPTGLIPQNATVTIVGNGFATTGNIISVGYGNTISNYRSLNKEFALSSSDNGTKITFVPEQHGIVGETQAVGGGWLTIINPLTGLNSNSVNLEVVKVSTDQTAGWKIYTNAQYGLEFKYPEKWKLSVETNILPIIKLEPIDKKFNVGISFGVVSPELDFAGISRTERPGAPEEFNRLKTLIENCNSNKIIGGNKFCIEDFVCFEGDKMINYSTINQNKNLIIKSGFSYSSGNFLKCLPENEIKSEADIFNQILSTFKFTK